MSDKVWTPRGEVDIELSQAFAAPWVVLIRMDCRGVPLHMLLPFPTTKAGLRLRWE